MASFGWLVSRRGAASDGAGAAGGRTAANVSVAFLGAGIGALVGAPLPSAPGGGGRTGPVGAGSPVTVRLTGGGGAGRAFGSTAASLGALLRMRFRSCAITAGL